MKINKIFIAVFLGLFIFSCQEQLDINNDPDDLNPELIPLSGQMPAATTGVATSMGSYYALIGGIWSQFYTQSALANQYKIIDDYSLSSNDYNGAWSSMYDALLDARKVKEKAAEQQNWNYYLISSVVEAYGFQLLTDMYGAVPYSDALNSSVLNPAYDSEEAIYDGLASSLHDALSKDLSTSQGNDPAEDDLVFGGNMSQWTKFANTLLLKIYLRQVNARPSVAQNGVQSLLNRNAEFLTTDAAITQYVDEANKSNPLYETNVRQLNVGTNLRTSTTMYSFLNNSDDTRLASYFTAGASQNQGDYNNANGANVGVAITGPTDPVYFISTAESAFLQAEAQLRYGSATQAESLYQQGVIAAFDQFDLDGSEFVASGGAYVFPNSGFEQRLESIIVQKWASFFPGRGAEAFIEQLRTGYPTISSVPQTSESYIPGQFAYSVNGVTGGLFPKRIVYPQLELQNNSNFPGIIAITENQWYE